METLKPIEHEAEPTKLDKALAFQDWWESTQHYHADLLEYDSIKWGSVVKEAFFAAATAPPTTQAAVAAALRKAAEVCSEQEKKSTACSASTKSHKDMMMYSNTATGAAYCKAGILALPRDDSALREICTRVANKTAREEPHPDWDWAIKRIVNDVLGETK